MKLEKKVDLALVLSSIAVLLSVYLMAVGVSTSQQPASGPDAFFLEQAREAGIRKRAFEQCLVSPEIDARIQEESAEAGRLGGNGTPFNVIQAPDGTLVPLPGAYPYEAFTDIIDRALAGELTQEEIDNAPDGSTMRPFDAERDYFKGSADAEITIFEYSDYECPFCARVHPVLNQVVANYPNVNWVYRNLPLSFHEQAVPAARAALCIGQEKGNDAFWTFTDTLLANQSVLQS